MAFKPENQVVVKEYVKYLSGLLIVIALLAMLLTDRIGVEQFVAILGSLTALSHFQQGAEARRLAETQKAVERTMALQPAPRSEYHPPPTDWNDKP